MRHWACSIVAANGILDYLRGDHCRRGTAMRRMPIHTTGNGGHTHTEASSSDPVTPLCPAAALMRPRQAERAFSAAGASIENARGAYHAAAWQLRGCGRAWPREAAAAGAPMAAAARRAHRMKPPAMHSVCRQTQAAPARKFAAARDAAAAHPAARSIEPPAMRCSAATLKPPRWQRHPPCGGRCNCGGGSPGRGKLAEAARNAHSITRLRRPRWRGCPVAAGETKRICRGTACPCASPARTPGTPRGP